MKENYHSSYIGIPIPESPLLEYIKTINRNRDFFHLTVLLLGIIDDPGLAKIKIAVSKYSDKISGIPLHPGKLVHYGPKRGILGIKIKGATELEKLRALLQKELPEFNSFNHCFTPHITIENLKKPFLTTEQREFFIKEGSAKQIEPFIPKDLSVFYRTGKGATALLYSHKLI